MTRQEFLQALDRHGGHLDRWPAHMREAAQAFAETDAAAAKELARLGSFEAAVARATAPGDVDAALVGRIVGAVAAQGGGGSGTHETVLTPTPRFFAFASAMTAAILVVGFVAGMSVPADTGNDAFAGLLFGSAYEDVAESIL